eukprot:4320486-Amphidinium_carterae.1
MSSYESWENALPVPPSVEWKWKKTVLQTAKGFRLHRDNKHETVLTIGARCFQSVPALLAAPFSCALWIVRVILRSADVDEGHSDLCVGFGRDWRLAAGTCSLRGMLLCRSILVLRLDGHFHLYA